MRKLPVHSVYFSLFLFVGSECVAVQSSFITPWKGMESPDCCTMRDCFDPLIFYHWCGGTALWWNNLCVRKHPTEIGQMLLGSISQVHELRSSELSSAQHHRFTVCILDKTVLARDLGQGGYDCPRRPTSQMKASSFDILDHLFFSFHFACLCLTHLPLLFP